MFKVYRNLGWFFKKEWKKYVLMAITLILLAFMTVIPGRILGEAIESIASKSLTYEGMIRFFIMLLILPLARYFLDFTYHFMMSSAGQKLAYLLRKRYLDHIFELDSKIYEKFTKGDLIARVTNDMEALTAAATTLLQEVFYQTAVLVFTITMMVTTISANLTAASVLIMPVVLTVLNIIRIRMRRYYRIHRKIYSNMTERVIESVEGVKVVRAYVNEDKDEARLSEAILGDINSWWKIVRFESVFNPLFELVYWVSYIIAFSYGSYLVITQALSIGDMVTFNIYLGSLYSPIMALGNIYNTMNNSIISDQRYMEIMNTRPEVHDEVDSKNIIDFNEIIFENVAFKYPFSDENSISNISFTIRKGETIGIVGKTGSGKSTLIRQLLREFTITEGRILIDGISIENYRVDDVCDLVGYVPQSHVLFSKTASENILVGNQSADERAISKALRVADFEKDIQYLASGLNTMIGERGTSLSGGQKQRLSIARAVIKNPLILILDDSLSAVDAKTEQNIIKELKETRKDKTNIIVAHRFSAIKEADKIIVLENGHIAAIGKHDELMYKNEWYQRQFLRQNYMEVKEYD